MDKYTPRLTRVLEENTDPAAAASAGAVGAAFLRRLLANETAVQALRLPHYVFDGQIGQKLPEFDEELLGASFERRVLALLVSSCRHMICCHTALWDDVTFTGCGCILG